MKTTVNLYDFREAFRAMDRKDQFTYEGLELLFDYLEQYEDETGEEIELDVIALCCDFSEDTWQDIAANYSIDTTEAEFDIDENDDIGKELVRHYLEENTILIGETERTFLYQLF